MRTIAVAVLLSGLAACTVKPADYRGRACDADHPCLDGRACVSGVCVAPSQVDGGVGGGVGGGGGGGGGGGNPCDGDPRLGQSCDAGQGPCERGGTFVCIANAVSCDAVPADAGVELCDSIDNDCNGTVDDNLAQPACTLTLGVCAGAQNTRACQSDGGFSDCSYGANFQSNETQCDGLDNDCDGVVDEVPLCLYTVAGQGPPNLIDGEPRTARFSFPQYLTLGPGGGDLFVADRDNHAIRKIPLDGGSVSTVAGTGLCGFADGPAATARFCEPSEVVFAANGDMYISDTANNRIRKLSSGMVSTLAGTGATGAANGAALSATFNQPVGLFITATGDLLIADRNNSRIRKYTAATGQVSTEAGTTSGNAEGSRATMQLDRPNDVCLDTLGNMFISEDSGDRVRYSPLVGNSIILAGSPTGADGYAEGVGTAAIFENPGQLALDEANRVVYVADDFNQRVRGVPLDGGSTFSFVGANSTGYANGTAATGFLESLPGMVLRGSEVLFTDSQNSVVRRASTAGVVYPNTTLESLAGIPPDERAIDGPIGTGNVWRPQAMALAPDGTLYFTDPRSNLLRTLTADGGLQTLIGDPVARPSGYVNGPFSTALLSDPYEVVFGPDGGLYIGEGAADALRVADINARTITRLSGSSAGNSGHVNGTVAAGRYARPIFMAWGKDGTNNDVLYVSDVGNIVVRKIDLAADSVTDFAGSFAVSTSTPVDGPLGTGRFVTLRGLTVDSSGNIWVADSNRVRKIDLTGNLTSPFPAGPTGFEDVAIDGDNLFAVGGNYVVEYRISTLTEIRRLATRNGWRDGLYGSTPAPGNYTWTSVLATPQYLLLTDREGGRIRRLWR